MADSLGSTTQLLERLLVENPQDRRMVLCKIASQTLGFDTSNTGSFQIDKEGLPQRADLIGTLNTQLSPDLVAVHFDFSMMPGIATRDIRAANSIVQHHSQDFCIPLLVFSEPQHTGVQFVYSDAMSSDKVSQQTISRLAIRRGEPITTTAERLDRIGRGISEGKQSPLTLLRDGFAVKPITDRFFRQYKNLYDDAVSEVSKHTSFEAASSLIQTLLNRLLFIHFVSRKGWLSFQGSKDYLRELWKDHCSTHKSANFYKDRLLRLFYDGLNTPLEERTDPALKELIGTVPFLNGGLFEKDSFHEDSVEIPDHIFNQIVGNGGLFNCYNFTTMESTAQDEEVAVDPEMLGKLFEETVNKKSAKGAFYTPRPVVSFMCRRAIKGYLERQNIKGITSECLALLVDYGDENAVDWYQAFEILKALEKVRIVDPSCGSGAFLLGALQEILAINNTLLRVGNTTQTLYSQKLAIISRNIHGADVDEMAVNTAMLRLWLSLAVDYEGEEAPLLPNLDFKVVAGDSLLAPDPSGIDMSGIEVESSGLGALSAKFLEAQGVEKERLKHQIYIKKNELAESFGFKKTTGVIDWRIDFADVMAEGGFDIVLANPPYVRPQEIVPPNAALTKLYTKSQYKKTLVKAHREAAKGSSDLYCYFFSRGMQLLKPGGKHVFICSNSWLDVSYGAILQLFLLKNSYLEEVYDSAVEKQFTTASINTVITVLCKRFHHPPPHLFWRQGSYVSMGPSRKLFSIPTCVPNTRSLRSF